MSETTKIQLTNVLDNLNLVPKITNLEIDRRDNSSTILTTFEIDSKLTDNNISWVTDKNITKLLKFTITYSLSENITNFLLKNTDILFGINADKLNSDEIIQVDRVIDSSFINFAKISSDLLNTSHISTITDKIILPSQDIKHFTVFIAIHLDNEALANKFNLKVTKLNKIIGTANYTNYINNFNYTNANINDISIFKDINFLNLTSLVYNNIVDNNKDKSFFKIKTEINYFSDLYSSFNKKDELNGIFKINLKDIFSNESRYSGLFNNSSFLNTFFSSPLNYLPEFIKISRVDRDNNSTIILNETYKDNIDTNNAKLSKLNLNDINKETLWLSFIDKNAKSLNKEYTYSIELTFKDYTIQYIDDLKIYILEQYKKMQEIVNIAHNGNYYDIATGKFNNNFYIILASNNLSISDTIINTANILSKFLEFSTDIIQSVQLLANSKYFNFNILENILNSLEFLKTEITTIQNMSYSKDSRHIKVLKAYNKSFIDFNKNNITKVSIIDNKIDEFAYSYITIDQYINRIKNEIKKYYTLTDLSTTNKFSYLTPNRIYGKYIELDQESMLSSNIDFNAYNRLLLDLYVDAIYEGEFSSFSENEKLLMLLSYFNIVKSSLSDQSINTVNHNIIRETKVTAINKNSVVNERLNSLLFDTFIRCIFTKDTKTVNFDTVNPLSKQSKLSKLTTDNTPFQIYSIYQLLSGNKFLNLNKEIFNNTLKDEKYSFAYYMNFKVIYNIEYLNIQDNKWYTLSLDILNALGASNLLCRYIQYKNENLDLNASNIDFHLVDQYFILHGTNTKIPEAVTAIVDDVKVSNIINNSTTPVIPSIIEQHIANTVASNTNNLIKPNTETSVPTITNIIAPKQTAPIIIKPTINIEPAAVSKIVAPVKASAQTSINITEVAAKPISPVIPVAVTINAPSTKTDNVARPVATALAPAQKIEPLGKQPTLVVNAAPSAGAQVTKNVINKGTLISPSAVITTNIKQQTTVAKTPTVSPLKK